MKKRPLSITIIAWILIVTGGISLISSSLAINNPMVRDIMGKSPIPITIQIAMLYLGLIVTLISAVFMLRGQAWARMLYVVWSVCGFVISFATSPMKAAMIPGFVVFLVITFFLFRPKAGEFFSSENTSNGHESL